MIGIINAQIVLEDKVLPDGVLLIEDGRIQAFGPAQQVQIPADAEIFDAENALVGPGFVDIHCHGGGGSQFDKDPLGAAQHFLKTGTTTVLATLYTDLNKENFLRAIDLVQDAMAQPGGKSIGGFYMEGPYTNPKFGASPEKNTWRGAIEKDAYGELIARAGKNAKIWVFAPEREGLLPFVEEARRVNPDVVFSVGHSEAKPAQVAAFKPYGLKNLTHCMDATGRQPCAGGTRNCGPDEACFLDDDMYAEVICDSAAIHVNPDMLKLIVKVKGKDKVILISDSFVINEPTPERFAHITDLSFDANGGLCGSKLTLNVACRNMVAHTGASVSDVFLMAARNPARLIGMEDEIGTIAIGKKANLVIINNDFAVRNVILEGEFVC